MTAAAPHPLPQPAEPTAHSLGAAYATLQVERRGPALVVTINRPEVLNALNATVLAELADLLARAQAQPDVRGLVLTGAGEKAFVAGADIAEIAGEAAENALAFSQRGQGLFSQIESFPKPIIAAVNGFALGGGCELACACHLRLASEQAQFGLPEVKLGLIPGYGGTQRLPRLIGQGKAIELMITADRITAGQALELGLVNYVVPQAELVAKAVEIIEKAARNSPFAIGQALGAVAQPQQTAGFQGEAVAFARAAASEDGREGTRAFLEKRAPNFKGR